MPPQHYEYGRVELRTSSASISAYCDGMIKDESRDVIFLSVLGTDSTVKAITADFLDAKKFDWKHSLEVMPDVETPDWRDKHGLTKSRELPFRRATTRLKDGGCHSIVALDSFFKDSGSVECVQKLLLLLPDDEPADLLYKWLHGEIPTPMMREWTQEIYSALTENWMAYKVAPEHLKEQHEARCDLLQPAVGKYRALAVRVTENSMDAVITNLIKSGKIRF